MEPEPLSPEARHFLEILYREDQDCPILMQPDQRRLAALLGKPVVLPSLETDR